MTTYLTNSRLVEPRENPVANGGALAYVRSGQLAADIRTAIALMHSLLDPDLATATNLTMSNAGATPVNAALERVNVSQF
jgi:hypothetical protein